jgi:multidrug efflux pump subunit AcrA (membrane-fusion protein)
MSETPRNTNLPFRIGAALVLAAAAGAVLFYSLRPVAVVEAVASGRAIDAKPGSVVVNPEYSMELRSVLGGRVLRKDFALDPGRAVREGEVLAQLDTTDLDIEIARDEIDFDTLKKRMAVGSSGELDLENARAALAVARHGHDFGTVSDNDLARAGRDVTALEERVALQKVADQAEYAADENTLEAKRHQREEMTIRAPFDGVVSDLFVHPGDLVSAAVPVATMITATRTVEARISEEDFADIRKGEEASVIFLPYGDRIFKAVVTKVLPTADPDTQRHTVFLDVAIDPAELVPGITGEVSIVVGSRDASVIIPRRALFAGNKVFVVSDGRVRARTVRKGYVWQTGVEVLEGVAPGEKVIVEDLDKFYDGDRVRTREISVDSRH